ncbi:MAG: FAD-binding protein [bacterium]|nr:FAD-binding protein [bacterium]
MSEPLATHVNLKVGGRADFYFEVGSDNDLETAVKTAIREEVPYTIIGNGANILVSDKGVRGLVIQNRSKNIKFLPYGFVEVDSGVDTSNLILQSKG